MGGSNWDQKAAEAVGKALPNEVSKLNSYSKYLNAIPVVGQIAAALTQGVATVDNAATAYGDTKEQADKAGQSSAQGRMAALSRAFGAGMKGVGGSSHDPGIYGSPGDNINRDWANTAGQIGNLLPNYSGGGSGGGGSWSMGQNPLSALDNPYFWGEEKAAKNSEWAQPLQGNFNNPQTKQAVEGGMNSFWGNIINRRSANDLPQDARITTLYPNAYMNQYGTGEVFVG